MEEHLKDEYSLIGWWIRIGFLGKRILCSVGGKVEAAYHCVSTLGWNLDILGKSTALDDYNK